MFLQPPAGCGDVRAGRAGRQTVLVRWAAFAFLGLAALGSFPRGADAAPCPGDAAPAGAIWTACLTAERSDGINAYGYQDSFLTGDVDLGMLSPATFLADVDFISGLLGGDTLSVVSLTLDDTGKLAIAFGGPTRMVGGIFRVGNASFAMADAARFAIVSPPLSEYEWSNSGLSWSDGQKITIALLPPYALEDPVPQASLARFGWTVAGQAVDAIGGRMMPGGGPHVTVGGQSLALSGGSAEPGVGNDGARVPEAHSLTTKSEHEGRATTVRDILLGSSFQLSAGGEGGGPSWTAWGRFATGGSEAEEDGTRMDGRVISGFIGADMARGPWLAGVALGLSESEDDYAATDDGRRARVRNSLTAVYPYARLALTETLEIWGLAGYGRGELTLTENPETDRALSYRPDIAMHTGAVGARGEVLSPAEADDLTLAVKSDAFWVRTSLEAVPDLVESEADVSRVRLLVEGSRTLETGGGTLTPELELGLRHDGGDAQTGTGVEARAGLLYAGEGFSIEGSAHTLVAHEESDYEEWSASGSLRIDPGASGRGLSLTVAPGWGAATSGPERQWSPAGARAPASDGGFAATRALEAELGYGLGLGSGPGVATPFAGLSLADGGGRAWRSGARWVITSGARLELEATRHEVEGGTARHGVMLRGSLRR